ncbi:MAG: response regulator transcription factor [Clostridioides sp.]|nr:response regulator transcription factor [Clostridioides sp.]
MSRILAVDDENSILALIHNALALDGHDVSTMNDPKEVLKMNLSNFDLILLDIMMSGMDGYELCSNIRQKTDAPIIFLTAKSLEIDIMTGLSIGADDYIRKPFSTVELRARINAHIRREKREHKNTLNVGNVAFDISGKEIFVNGEKVPMTKSEYLICEFLAKNRGQVFSKENIYVKVFGYGGESDSSTIVEHIKNVRSKLGLYGESPVKTVWGIGYKWEI